eukprot:TRINITY_DN19329_c0_g1_i1.p1 TRINITY_DN19329_c0_g1~~TRINITY_DN19329_c0_g1_i1.p1  ORF type:complete len:235 (+),score=37.02 TRINITY_DN19329_c0_g1_i1:102-806(+)
MAASDTWLREYEEAVKLADDIMARIQERNEMIRDREDPTRLVSSTRRKITMLSTKSDRLESLLKNPDSLKISAKELQRRQDMLMGVRYRIKQMSSTLNAAQTFNRANLLGQDPLRIGPPGETSRTQGVDNRGVISLQTQIMREQDEELAGLESTVTSTKHIALAVNEELDLHNRLLTAIDEGVDATSSNLKMAQRRLTQFTRNVGKDCSFVTFLMVAIVLAIILVAVLDILKYF